MKQAGISFLELIVVVAVLGVVATLVAPNFKGWRAKSNLFSDYKATIAQIDYIKTRARVLNGTATLICVSPTQLSYQVSTNPQGGTATISPNYAANLVEDPRSTSLNANILSGNTTVVSSLCNNLKGVFLSNGQAGMEGNGSQIDLELRVGNNRNNGAYRIAVSQSTGFVQKYKWSATNNIWVEQD